MDPEPLDAELEPSVKTLMEEDEEATSSILDSYAEGAEATKVETISKASGRKLSSFVWQVFTRPFNDLAACMQCGAEMKVVNGSTSALRKHVFNKHFEIYEKYVKLEQDNLRNKASKPDTPTSGGQKSKKRKLRAKSDASWAEPTEVADWLECEEEALPQHLMNQATWNIANSFQTEKRLQRVAEFHNWQSERVLELPRDLQRKYFQVMCSVVNDLEQEADSRFNE